MENYCEAYPLDIATDSFSENSLSLGDSQYFSIKARCENFYVPDSVNYLGPLCCIFEHAVSNIPMEAMEQEAYALLSFSSVPEDARNFMADKILACANNMANVTHKNQKILHMSVFISITRLVHGDGVVVESMEDRGHGSVMEGLEKVKVTEKYDCAICLQDFEVDSEGVRMLCLHLFHRTCMVNWLQRSRSCPLCRFQMPTNESEWRENQSYGVNV